LERFIQTKAHVPNAPEETEGLAIGQCVAHFTRNYPTSIRELFEVMRQYARSDYDLKEAKGGKEFIEAST
jgi:hypothetical protein